MKNIKNILLLILALCITAISFSKEENTDAIYNTLVKEYTLNPDGTVEFHLRKEVKLLTHFAFHRLFGETFIIYDTTSQSLKINEAYTIMADGKKVTAPSNAFNKVLPGFAANIPAFNHLREMVVTHTGLEVGSTIVLDYTLTTKGSFLPYLMGNELIGENVPVRAMQVIVNVPAGAKLNHKMLNLRTAPETGKDGKFDVYTWKFTGLKATPQESYIDQASLPRLIFSTAKDLDQAIAAIAAQPAFRHETGADFAKRIDQVSSENKEDLKKMLALQDLVISEVKLADVPLQYTGYKVRTAAECWQSANATVLEKAVMLADALSRVNINAIPVVLLPASQFDPALGDPLQFEQFVVQVNPREMGRFYLSVTRKNEQNLIYSLEGLTVVPLNGAADKLVTFKEDGMKENGISLTGDLSIADTALIKGSLTMELEGYKNPALKIYGNADAVKTYLSGNLGPSSVVTYETKKTNPEGTETKFQVEKKKPLVKTGGYYFLDLPVLNNGIAQYHLDASSDTREAPLKLGGDIEEEYTYTITLPDGWTLLNPKTRLTLSNEAGKLDLELQQKKNTVVFSKNLKVNERIEAKDYREFLELIRTFGDERYSRLVLVPAK